MNHTFKHARPSTARLRAQQRHIELLHIDGPVPNPTCPVCNRQLSHTQGRVFTTIEAYHLVDLWICHDCLIETPNHFISSAIHANFTNQRKLSQTPPKNK